MMTAVVDYNLGYQLRMVVIALLRQTVTTGIRYLNGPADGADGAEHIGCDGHVHGNVGSTFVCTITYVHVNLKKKIIVMKYFNTISGILSSSFGKISRVSP